MTPLGAARAHLKLVALTLVGLAFSHSPRASDEAIATDRPDFVESADVVGKGRFQLETGFGWERAVDSPGIKRRSTSTPTLLRFGVSDSIELRLETDGYSRARLDDAATSTVTRESGFADLSPGAKWHMLDGDEATGRPAIAWLLHVELDSGKPSDHDRAADAQTRPRLRHRRLTHRDTWPACGGRTQGTRDIEQWHANRIHLAENTRRRTPCPTSCCMTTRRARHSAAALPSWRARCAARSAHAE